MDEQEISNIVIVGAGQAGGEVAFQLRQYGFTGAITLIGEEMQLPYTRPPLSKGFLAGETALDALLTRGAAAYEKFNVDIRTGTRVTGIDRHNRHLTLQDGAQIPYDRLVLATGGRPRVIQVPGADLGNIFYLRTVADVERIRPELLPGKRLVIVGGGYIGLEVAAVATKRGLHVTVLEGAPRVLARVTSPEMSAFYERVHGEQGVDIRTGVAVSGFIAGADGTRVAEVECGEAATVAADLVIIGIGLIPNTELAAGAGLLVDNGIVVDAEARSSDPHILAIGDCASHAHHGFLQRKVRLESVPNASEQARTAAAALCGKPAPSATPPWFWSDQYGLKLQMVGLSDGYDRVVLRGDPEQNSFIAFYLRNDEIIAADAVNRIADFMAAKRIVAERRTIAAAVLADESQPLKAIIAA
jgi:3-phenylpropionate/trans-cinnamate dioxygenase ferredoxin reductase subunit